MKRLLLALALLLGLTALFVSCNKDNGGSSSSIVGTWKVVWTKYDEAEFSVGTVLTFEEGGTILYDGYPVYQYRYEASTKTIKFGGSGFCKVLSLTTNSMSWGDGYSDDDEVIIKFKKQ